MSYTTYYTVIVVASPVPDEHLISYAREGLLFYSAEKRQMHMLFDEGLITDWSCPTGPMIGDYYDPSISPETYVINKLNDEPYIIADFDAAEVGKAMRNATSQAPKIQ